MENEVQENNIISDAEDKVVIDIGEELKQKRVELGLDQRKVAEQLKLPMGQIAALETNNFDYFRSKTFARGFLKNYIRLLELDEDKLLAAFDELTKPAETETIIEPINKNKKQAQLADPIVIFASIVIVALLIFLAFLWPTMMQSSDVDTAPEVEEELIIEEVGVVEGEADLTEVAKRELESEILQAELGAPETPNDIGDSNEVITGLSAETIALLRDAGVDPDAIEVPERAVEETIEFDLEEQEEVLPFYTDDLVVEYSIDCWTEVRDSKGEILFSGVKLAGSTLGLTADGTYKIVFGYAPGVKVITFKGTEIDLAPYTRQNLARLELK